MDATCQTLTSRGALRRPRNRDRRTWAPRPDGCCRESRDRSPEHAEPSRFLPHVQGLRAIAVLAVVLYHFWPARLPGGYVGVDVFFVISGFLITSHLMRELYRDRHRAARPVLRAARARLLPASLLVLLFCALVAMSPFLTPTSGPAERGPRDLRVDLYVENWFLALNSVDYLNTAATRRPCSTTGRCRSRSSST